MKGFNGFTSQLTTVAIPYNVDSEKEMVFYNIITYILVKHNVIQHTGMPNKDGIALVEMRSYSKTEHAKVLRCVKELLKQKDAVLTERNLYNYYD